MLTRSERIRMAHPLVVHCKRARYDVYIGRPSQWGNPFQIGRDGTRAQVIARYERWLEEQPELLAALPELAGKTSRDRASACGKRTGPPRRAPSVGSASPDGRAFRAPDAGLTQTP